MYLIKQKYQIFELLTNKPLIPYRGGRNPHIGVQDKFHESRDTKEKKINTLIFAFPYKLLKNLPIFQTTRTNHSFGFIDQVKK